MGELDPLHLHQSFLVPRLQAVKTRLPLAWLLLCGLASTPSKSTLHLLLCFSRVFSDTDLHLLSFPPSWLRFPEPACCPDLFWGADLSSSSPLLPTKSCLLRLRNWEMKDGSTGGFSLFLGPSFLSH